MTHKTKNLLNLIDHLDETCDGVQMRLLAKRLLTERDDAQEAAEEYWKAWQEEHERHRETIADSLAREMTVEDDRDRLRSALERYGYHTAECPAFLEMPATAPDCTCGLDEALLEGGRR